MQERSRDVVRDVPWARLPETDKSALLRPPDLHMPLMVQEWTPAYFCLASRAVSLLSAKASRLRHDLRLCLRGGSMGGPSPVGTWSTKKAMVKNEAGAGEDGLDMKRAGADGAGTQHSSQGNFQLSVPLLLQPSSHPNTLLDPPTWLLPTQGWHLHLCLPMAGDMDRMQPPQSDTQHSCVHANPSLAPAEQ